MANNQIGDNNIYEFLTQPVPLWALVITLAIPMTQFVIGMAVEATANLRTARKAPGPFPAGCGRCGRVVRDLAAEFCEGCGRRFEN